MNKPNLNTQRMAGETNPYFEKVNALHGLDQLCQDIGLNKDSVVLEIGCFNGISTSLFAYYAKEVHAVDIWFSPQMNSNVIPNYNNIKFIQGNSANILPTLPDNYFDMIYIDADHSYEAVKNDITLSISKLKSDGYLCGHDYDEHIKNGVFRAVNEIFGKPTKVYEDQSWRVK